MQLHLFMIGHKKLFQDLKEPIKYVSTVCGFSDVSFVNNLFTVIPQISHSWHPGALDC